MSAYVINSLELASLINYYGDKKGLVNAERVELLNSLHSENVKSVNYRYNDTDKADNYSNMPEGVKVLDSEAEAYDLASSLVYQSCEHDDYYDGEAYKSTQAIMLALLSGYYGRDNTPIIHPLVGSCYLSRPGQNLTFITGTAAEEGRSAFIGANGLQTIKTKLSTISFNRDTGKTRQSSTGLEMAQKQIEESSRIYTSQWKLSAEQLYSLKEKASTEVMQAKQSYQQNRDEEDRARAAFADKVRPLIPEGAKAAIIATYDIRDCDSQSDYFNTISGDSVLLGFSPHTRNLFPEMRKVIEASGTTNAEILKLVDSKDFECRDGGRYGSRRWIKDGSEYDSGWKVYKIAFHGDAVSCLPICSLAMDEAEQPETPADERKKILVAINEEKQGIEIFFTDKPERETLSTLKEYGFRWHNKLKKWYAKQNETRLTVAATLAGVSVEMLTMKPASDTIH